jgi:flagellar biosynthetic protein FliO
MIWAAAKMILGLGSVLAILLLLIWLCKRAAPGKGSFPGEGQVRLLTSKPIAPRKFVSLVEIGGQVLVLGVSEAQITLLDKIENREFMAKTDTQHPLKSEPLSILDYFSLRRRGLNRGPLRIFNGK